MPFFSGPGGASSLIAAGQPYALGEMYMPDDSGDAGYVESWACNVDTEDGPGASFPMTQISEWGPGVSVGWGEEVICVVTNRKPGTTTPTTTPTVVPVLDLQIDKTGVVTEDILVADGVATVEWTLTVSHGPGSNSNAVGATITDPAPAGMTFTSVTSARHDLLDR